MINVSVTGGSTFPDVTTLMNGLGYDPKTIVAQRVASMTPGYAVMSKEEQDKLVVDTKTQLKDNSPAEKQVKQEIIHGNNLASNIGNNIILVPAIFTSPTAAMALASDIPKFLEILSNLGLLDEDNDTVKAMMTAIKAIVLVINTMAVTISGINTALKALLLITDENVNIIPPPPQITITES